MEGDSGKSSSGINDVITATGCAVSRSSVRRRSRVILSIRVLYALGRVSTTFGLFTFVLPSNYIGKPKPGDNRLFKILYIAESTMLIWFLKNQRVCANLAEEDWPTKEVIRSKWISRINTRLTLDRASAHTKHGSLATKKNLVLKTWRP